MHVSILMKGEMISNCILAHFARRVKRALYGALLNIVFYHMDGILEQNMTWYDILVSDM